MSILLPEAPPSAFVLKINNARSSPCSIRIDEGMSNVFPWTVIIGGFQTSGKA